LTVARRGILSDTGVGYFSRVRKKDICSLYETKTVI